MKISQLLLVLSVLAVTSCTVQKRHFNKGWNIEWNSKHGTARNTTKSTDNNNQDVAVAPVASTTENSSFISDDVQEPTELIRFSSDPIAIETAKETPSTVRSSKSFTRRVLHQLVKPKPKLGQKNERTPAGKINFILGPASAGLITAGWILFFVQVAMGIASYAWIPIILVGFLGALATLYFSSRAEKQLAATPGKYNPFTGKKWVYIALGIAALGLLIGAFVH